MIFLVCNLLGGFLIMSVMNVEMLNKEYLIGELKKMGKYAYKFINMVDFVLSGNFDEYFVELYEKFQKK
jgi:hypothetical protein